MVLKKNCWPFEQNGSFCKKYPFNPVIDTIYDHEPVRYINTGVMIGESSSVIDWFTICIREMEKSNYTYKDDQMLASILFSNGTFPIQLDVYSEIIQSMHLAVTDVLVHSRYGVFINRKTGTTPSIIHFNGNKKRFPELSQNLWFNKNGTKFVVKDSQGFLCMNGTFVSYKSVCSGY